MSQFIKHLEAIGIHEKFDIDISFQDGINIIHGSNGTGKTTLLHILANAVNEDFRRFGYLKFKKLTITLDDDTQIIINQKDFFTKPDEGKTTVLINQKEVISYTFKELREQERKENNVDLPISERRYLLPPQKKSDIDLKVTYFPAFRTMIEAWATLDENDIRYMYQRSPNLRKVLRSSSRSTELARILFGKFVPQLEYPSPIEIEENINSEVIDAQLKIASVDRSLLSQSFTQFAEVIYLSTDTEENTKSPQQLIKEITEISEKLKRLPFQINWEDSDNVYEKLPAKLKILESEDTQYKIILSRVLSVYKKALQKRLDEQTKAYSSIEIYLESVNSFLEKKKLEIDSTRSPERRSKLGVKIGDEETISGLQTLSSGERQIVGLIYAASHMTDGRVVLIDEPEISLHIEWQRKLLPEMVKQLGEKQLIVCTHSPIIASKYRDRMIELELKPTDKANLDKDSFEDQYETDIELDSIPF